MPKAQKLLDKLILPKTKIMYEKLGIPEPEAWKWIILCLFPMGIMLIPTAFFDGWETIPSIKEYPNWVNTAIGILLVFGSGFIIYSWYGKKGVTQGWRVRQAIRGYYFIATAFLALSLCGAPTAFETVLTFFMSTGTFLGSVSRIITLVRVYPLLLKEVERL